VAYSDERIEGLTTTDARVRLLRTVPSVRPVTAAAFVAALDEVTPFRGAHEVEAYLGLVPRELSSGERQQRGRITKSGPSRVRRLLVQTAVSIVRLRDPRTADLREWAMTPPPRQEGGDGGLGPALGRHPLRHAARRDPLRTATAGALPPDDGLDAGPGGTMSDPPAHR
jgi:hypothetical protein